MTIIHPFPPTLTYSPYLDELYRVLAPDFTIDRRSPRRAIPALLLGRGGRILHLHFFDAVVQRPSKLSTWVRYVAWIMLLMLLRWRGVMIVWTVHNATPHECLHPDIARRTTQHVLNQCHAVTVHHHATRALLLEQYHTTTPISVIPHGHSTQPFGPLPPHQLARQQLGLTLEAPLLLYLGMIRRYKGIETLIDAMELLPHAHLVIAGHVADPIYLSEIHQHTARRINVTIRPRFLPEHEAAQYLAACDLLVLPYRSITTSGMLVAAQAAGIVCVVPNLAPLLEQVRDGVTGFVFHADNSSSLVHTIERALANPQRDQIGKASQRALANHTWAQVGQQFVTLFRQLCPPSS